MIKYPNMKLKIVTTPNPILLEKSKKISRIDDSIKQLATDMAETISDYGSEHETGVALAAVQVGVPVRMTVVRGDEGDYIALINPEIVKESKTQEEDIEGCMSVPQKYGRVVRPCKIKVRGLDINGKKMELKAEGLMARILCHEIDHMDGKLFTSRAIGGEIYKLNSKGELT
jgi:peptide deformylase